MLVSALVSAQAQVLPTQDSAQSPTALPCGPMGCVGAGTGGGISATAQPASAAPISIRSNDEVENTATPVASTATVPTASSGAARAAIPIPPLPVRLSDFELFVRDTIGYTLPVYGRDLFEGSQTTAFQAANITAPADYVIGPGDEVRVRAVGKVDVDVRTRVDGGGQIFIPQVGPITVAGIPAAELTGVVRRAIAKQFKGFELTVTLGQLRPIQIFVLGQAQKPGTYTVSSLSSLVNALFASGGPSGSGSLRDIQLIRNNQTVAHFDVYRLLLSGDKSADRHLLAGDILYIPPIGPQIAVAGDVGNPGIYELNGPNTVDDLLRYAAGLTPVAAASRATLDRVLDHTRRSVLNFPLDAAGRATALQGGDILRILPISARIDDAVTLRGPVGSPGRYAWREGMRVQDLIPARTSLLTRDFYNQRNALDLPAAPTGILPPDSPQPRTLNGNTSAPNAAPAGSTQNRSLTGGDARFSPAPGTTADDRVSVPPTMQHDTDINWTYATIERLDPQDLKVHLLPFNLGMAIDQPASAENKTLLAGDVIVLYSSRDLQLPLELTTKFVRIDGQVVAPGVYQVNGTETLRDLVRRAGGLAPHAYLYASQLTRESVRADQEEKLQRLLQRERTEAFSPSNVITQRSSAGGGADTSSGELQLRRAYLAELATMHATGRVVLALKPDSRILQDVPDLELQDADHFFIPALPNTVNVLGSVYNSGAFRYIDHGRVKRYLNAAGGPEREADHGRDFILRADGSLISRARISNFDRQVIYPGDSIVVPANFKGRKAPIDFLDLTTAVGSLALTAVAIKALN